MKPTYKTRYMSVNHPLHSELVKNANAGPNPNITGMKKKYWGMNAKCIRSGQYVYNVSCNKTLWDAAE